MSDSLATPWHERHKGKIILWGLLGPFMAILAFVFRADIWPRLVTAGSWLGSLFAVLWHWLWAPHGVPGWGLALLALIALPGLRLWFWIATGRPGNVLYQVILEAIRWEALISPQGRILGMPVPYCPQCQCRIEPIYQPSPASQSGFVTIYRCEDEECKGTLRAVVGHPTVVTDRITRLIEAKWRRGELRPQRKRRLGITPEPPPMAPARLEEQP